MKILYKLIKNILLSVVIFIFIYLGYSTYKHINSTNYEPPTIKQIKEIARISSLNIIVSGLVDADSDTYFIQKHVVAFIEADVIISSNIDNIKIYTNKSEKHVTLSMPTPQISSIDIDKFKIVASSEKTFGLIPRLGYINTDTTDTASANALFEGKKIIKEKAGNKKYIEQAK